MWAFHCREVPLAYQNNFSEEQVQIAQESVQASQILGPKLANSIGTFATGKLNEAAALKLKADTTDNPEEAAQLNKKAAQLEANWGESGALRTLDHGLASGLTYASLESAIGGIVATLAANGLGDLQDQLAGVLQEAGINKDLSQSLAGLASATSTAAIGKCSGW